MIRAEDLFARVSAGEAGGYRRESLMEHPLEDAEIVALLRWMEATCCAGRWK
jgi:hypothetical protein